MNRFSGGMHLTGLASLSCVELLDNPALDDPPLPGETNREVGCHICTLITGVFFQCSIRPILAEPSMSNVLGQSDDTSCTFPASILLRLPSTCLPQRRAPTAAPAQCCACACAATAVSCSTPPAAPRRSRWMGTRQRGWSGTSPAARSGSSCRGARASARPASASDEAGLRARRRHGRREAARETVGGSLPHPAVGRLKRAQGKALTYLHSLALFSVHRECIPAVIPASLRGN